MTTNQTIDGVSLLPCPFCGGEPYGTHDHYVHDDLSPMPCVECRSCSAHLKAHDWNRRVEPAAQPQGEPVAWDIHWSDNGEFYFTLRRRERLYKYADDPDFKVVPLYAEQPAPVAVSIDENVEFEKWWMSTPMLRKQKIQIAQEAWFARASLSK